MKAEECKHLHGKCWCANHIYYGEDGRTIRMAPCVLKEPVAEALSIQCPDFAPKTEKK